MRPVGLRGSSFARAVSSGSCSFRDVQPRFRVPAIFNSIPPASTPTPASTTTQFTMSNKELEQRCTTLRHDLKAWEKNFASQHNGQRAGRDDIKADSVICMHATTYELLGYYADSSQLKSTRNTTNSERYYRARLLPRRRLNEPQAAKPPITSNAPQKRTPGKPWQPR